MAIGRKTTYGWDEPPDASQVRLPHVDKFIRLSTATRFGYHWGDVDVSFQLFKHGMVWDGNLASKDSRNHFVRNGYAVRAQGFTSFTGRGSLAFLLSWAVWKAAVKKWRHTRHNPFVATMAQTRRAMN